MAVTAAKGEVVAVGKVEEAEEMAAPVAVVALVCSFWHVLRCKGSKTENRRKGGSFQSLEQHYVIRLYLP